MLDGTRKGTMWLKSEEDPRWNWKAEGQVGMFSKPTKLQKKIEEYKEKYGNPPDDLEWGYEKW